MCSFLNFSDVRNYLHKSTSLFFLLSGRECVNNNVTHQWRQFMPQFQSRRTKYPDKADVFQQTKPTNHPGMPQIRNNSINTILRGVYVGTIFVLFHHNLFKGHTRCIFQMCSHEFMCLLIRGKKQLMCLMLCF